MLFRTLTLALLLVSSAAAAREDSEWTCCDFGVDPRAGLLGT